MGNTHKNIVLRFLLAMAVAIVACACGHKDEPTPPPPPVERTAPRTILVYMVATNNLGTGGFDTSDLREMDTFAKNGGLDKGGRLIVYHASTKGIVLKEITKDGTDTLKVYPSGTLSVTIDQMRRVISDTKTLAPAYDYGMVLWSHASGWIQDGVAEAAPAKYSFGSDGTTNGKKMNVTSLAQALSGQDLSLIYCDCCYMGGVEVAYQLRDVAPYIVCSPAEDPADGMPYNLSLPHLFNTDIPVKEAAIGAARTTFDYYNSVFKTGNCPCTLTVVETAGMEDLAAATRRVYEAATTAYNSEYSYQKFETGVSCHYFDLDEYVESICPDPELLAEWRSALDRAVVYRDATPYVWSSFPIKRYCGLSTNIIASRQDANTKGYNTTDWYADVVDYLFN